MFDIIISIIAFVVILGIVIFIHELGHFIFAKKAGILCHEFSLGMGPIIYKKKVNETLYCIRALPIGGFVSMAGGEVNEAYLAKGQKIAIKFESGCVKEIIFDLNKESDAEGILVDFDVYGKDSSELFIVLENEGIEKKYPVLRDCVYIFSKKEPLQISVFEKSFDGKNKRNRFMTIFMGAGMNFILAFVLFMIASLFVGTPNMKSTKIGEVSNMSGNEGLLLKDDIIKEIKLNGNWVVVKTWDEFSQKMNNLKGYQNIELKIERKEEIQTVNLKATIFINSIGIGSSLDSSKAEIGYVFGKASKSGFKPKDVITKMKYDNIEKQVTSWKDICEVVANFDVKEIEFTMSDGKKETVETYGDVVLNSQNVEKIDSKIGISPIYSFSFPDFIVSGFVGIKNVGIQIFATLGLLFGGSKQIGVGDLSGPVGMFSIISDLVKQGFWSLVSFTAFLSVNLGILNLLPIPALDGGRLAFLGYEAVTKKPVNKKFENTVNTVMLFLLMGLMLFVLYNDILRVV